MTGARLHAASAEVSEPLARLNSPGLAVVYLTAGASYWLAFTTPGAAREVAAACESAAGLLEGPQITEGT